MPHGAVLGVFAALLDHEVVQHGLDGAHDLRNGVLREPRVSGVEDLPSLLRLFEVP